MLRARMLFGIGFIAVLLAVVVVDYYVNEPYWGWLALCLMLGALAAHELASLLGRSHPGAHRGLLYAAVPGLVVVHWVPYFSASSAPLDRWVLLLGGLVVLGYVLYVAGVVEFASRGGTLRGTAATALAVLYLAGGASAVASIRWLQSGLFALLYFLTTTKSADSGAYVVGSLFGRTPLARSISPKKTVEGAAGGVLVAVAVGALFGLFSDRAVLGLAESMILAGVLGCWGQVGDLFESCLKREAGVKDSSSWMAGLGGVLDMLDSVIWNGPLFVLWWQIRHL